MAEPRRSTRARGEASASATAIGSSLANAEREEEANGSGGGGGRRRQQSPSPHRQARSPSQSKTTPTTTKNHRHLDDNGDNDNAPAPQTSLPLPPLRDELPSMALLTLLYAIQGIPLGLTMGSVPFLLRDGAAAAAAAAAAASSSSSSTTPTSALTAVGLFSTAAWPYAAKLAWSPIVDATTLSFPVPGAFFDAFEKAKEKVVSSLLSLLLFLKATAEGTARTTAKKRNRARKETSSLSLPSPSKSSPSPSSSSSSSRYCYVFEQSPRKSWIVPVQLLTSALLLSRGAAAAAAVARGDAPSATAFFFALVLLAATQDVAVDGWALTLLSRGRVGWASTCQTIGTNLGFFASFTALMALGDSGFCDRWIHSWRKQRLGADSSSTSKTTTATSALFGRAPARSPSSSFFFKKAAAAATTATSASSNGGALWSLRGYLRFWGWAYLVVTLFVAVFVPEKKEKKEKKEEGRKENELTSDDNDDDDDDEGGGVFSEISEAYRRLADVVSLRSVKRLCALLLTCRLAILPAEAAAALALSAKGVPREALAGLVLLQLPAEALAAFLAGRAGAGGAGGAGGGGKGNNKRGGGASRAWVRGYWLRLAAALATTALVVSQAPSCPQVTSPSSSSSSNPSSSCLPPLRFSLLALAGLLTAFSATLQFTCMGAVFSLVSDADMGGTYLTLLNTVANLGITVPRGAVLAAVDKFGLGVVSAVFVALGAVAGVFWYSEELPRLEGLPTEAWRAGTATEEENEEKDSKTKKRRKKKKE